MKKLYFSILYLLLTHLVIAQYTPKESMLGVRGGGSVGITYKKFFGNNFAFEAIGARDFSRQYGGLFFSGLFEKHAPLAGKRFSALLGGGPSYHIKRKSAGIAAVIGFDWRILNSPINLQADWSPAYYFKGEDKFSTVNAAISLRYILNRKKVYSEE